MAGRRGGSEPAAVSHHGSVSKSERAVIEDALKAGRLPAVVATSSLELGIDMGSIDLMVQVGVPSSASGLQRLGRAGHRLDAVSRRVLPDPSGRPAGHGGRGPADAGGQDRGHEVPQHPLDVLSQQIVAMVCHGRLAHRRPLRGDHRRVRIHTASALGVRCRPGHVVRPVPVRRLRATQTATGVGPDHRNVDRAKAPSVRRW